MASVKILADFEIAPTSGVNTFTTNSDNIYIGKETTKTVSVDYGIGATHTFETRDTLTKYLNDLKTGTGVDIAAKLGTSSTYLTYANLNPIYQWYTTALDATGQANSIIDTWAEISKFVEGFKNSDKLQDYLANNYVAKTGSTMTGTLNVPTLNVTGAATFNLAINGDLLGNATTADRLKLSAQVGSASLPIYFNGGLPVACTASSIFSNLTTDTSNAISITIAGQDRTIPTSSLKDSLGLQLFEPPAGVENEDGSYTKTNDGQGGYLYIPSIKAWYNAKYGSLLDNGTREDVYELEASLLIDPNDINSLNLTLINGFGDLVPILELKLPTIDYELVPIGCSPTRIEDDGDSYAFDGVADEAVYSALLRQRGVFEPILRNGYVSLENMAYAYSFLTESDTLGQFRNQDSTYYGYLLQHDINIVDCCVGRGDTIFSIEASNTKTNPLERITYFLFLRGGEISCYREDNNADEIATHYFAYNKGTYIGNATTPVYVDLTGELKACNPYPTTLPANGGNADTATNVAWSGVTNTPTTLTGYGITDALSSSTQYAAGDSVGGSAKYVRWSSASSNVSRRIPFAYDGTTETTDSRVRLVYDDDFRYNPSTNTLIVGSITGNSATATKLSSITDGLINDEKKLIVLGGEGVIYTVPNIKANYAKNTLTITSTSGLSLEFRAVRTGGSDVSLMVGSENTNHGVYSNTASKWIVYSDASGNVTLNGNAATVTNGVYTNTELTISGAKTFSGTNGFTYSGIGTASDDAYRPVWFSYNGVNGRPVLDANDFKYNPSINTLSVPNIILSGKVTSSTAEIDSLTAGNLVVQGTSSLGTITSGTWNASTIAADYLPLGGTDDGTKRWVKKDATTGLLYIDLRNDIQILPTGNKTAHLYIGPSGNTNTTASTDNGNTYIKLYEDSTAKESYKITGSGSVSVTNDANGNITITGTTYINNVSTPDEAIYVVGTEDAYTSKSGLINNNWTDVATLTSYSGTYAIQIMDTANSLTNCYSGIMILNGSTGRRDEIALHACMATSSDATPPTRLYASTMSGVLALSSLDATATAHSLKIKILKLIAL